MRPVFTTAILSTFIAAIAPQTVFAQNTDDNGKSARLITSSVENIPRRGLVAVDMRCKDDDALYVESRLRGWLNDQGFQVEDRAPMTMRVEMTPCEDVGLLPGRGSVADAYSGSSEASEFTSHAAPLIRVPIGKRADRPTRVTIKMLLFAPGKKPLWSAHISSNSKITGQRRHKANLTDIALTAFGETKREDVSLN